eukprot:2600837-Pyramimonas_sp.AAC.1
MRHHWLVEAALETAYPLWQLKLSLKLYCSPRILTLGSAVSDAVHSQQSVPPGDGHATTMLKLLLTKPLDLLKQHHPALQLAAVADDLALHRVGGLIRVTREVADAASRLQALLEA